MKMFFQLFNIGENGSFLIVNKRKYIFINLPKYSKKRLYKYIFNLVK